MGHLDVNSRDDELRAALDGERTNAAELRRIVAEQAAALAKIKRRRSVRAVLALDRHIRPLLEFVSTFTQRFRMSLNQARVLGGGIRRRRGLSERRRVVAAAIESLAPTQRKPRSRSVVIVTDHPLATGLRAMLHEDDEVVVVATRRLDSVSFSSHQIITSPAPESAAAAAARGAAAASGELLCFLSPTSEPLEQGWLARLTSAIVGDVVAAAPLLLHPERPLHHATAHDLRVRELGRDVIANSEGWPTVQAREAGRSPDPSRPPTEVFAASAACLLVDRRAYDEVGGLAALDDLDAAMVDLCARLRARGGRVIAVSESIVVDHRPIHSITELTTPIDPSGRAWREVIHREGPALMRRTGMRDTEASLNIALTVAAPSSKVAPRWGDWHLAEAFARSLRRLGHSVRVQTADRADHPSVRCCDVHVVLRGVQAFRRSPGQRHVLWIISHPEAIDPRECDEADLVLVASPRLAAHLRERTATPVEVLLQATDPQRFRPLPPDDGHAHPVAVVAKPRDVLRKSVADALAVGIRPAIYGSGWDELVDPTLVVSDYVPNQILPVVYSSIGLLLIDHWDGMRAWGMISNRVFDALACGTPVISDFLPEVRELFGDAVPMFRDGAELRSLVDASLTDPGAARQRAAAGREQVLAAHTFDHRAKTFLEALARHRLDPPPHHGPSPTPR
jgi:GT2 family glycosyltransferase